MLDSSSRRSLSDHQIHNPSLLTVANMQSFESRRHSPGFSDQVQRMPKKPCAIRSVSEPSIVGVALGTEGARWARACWRREAKNLGGKNKIMINSIQILKGYTAWKEHQEIALEESNKGWTFVACSEIDYRHNMRLNGRNIMFLPRYVSEKVIEDILLNIAKKKVPMTYPRKVEGLYFLRNRGR